MPNPPVYTRKRIKDLQSVLSFEISYFYWAYRQTQSAEAHLLIEGMCNTLLHLKHELDALW
jgi:hypothetical protein